MVMLDWLLTRRWQLTVQLLCGVLSSALFTVVRPLHFPLACLSPVFVVIIIASLAQDQHIGSRLQITGLLLGPTWLAVVLAGGLMTLAKLAEDPHKPLNSGYITAASVLALLGLMVLVVARAAAPPGPAKLMGILAAVMYGILVLISVGSVSIVGLWSHAVGSVLLAMTVATVSSLLVGFFVAPSLASDEVATLTAEALRGAGAIISYHTSLLMAQQQRQQRLSSNSNKQHNSSKPVLSTSTRQQNGAHTERPAAAAAAQAGKGLQQLQTSDSSFWHHPHIAHKQSAVSSKKPSMKRASTTAAAFDPTRAAVELHKALEAQHSHTTFDWVVDEPGTWTSKTAAALTEGVTSLSSMPKSQLQGHNSKEMPSDIELQQSETQVSAQPDSDNRGHLDDGNGDASSIHSTRSEYSTSGSSSRLSDALVTPLQGPTDKQQQQQGCQKEGEQPAHGPRLSEQLLHDAVLFSAPENTVAAWAAAAAAVTAGRQGSLAPALSLEVQDINLNSAAVEEDSARRHSLEYAASIEFQPEMDDKAFLDMMRTLSRSKPYGSTASLDKLASNSRIPPNKPAMSAASTAGSVLDQPTAAAGLQQQGDEGRCSRQNSRFGAASNSSSLRANSWLSGHRLSSFFGTLSNGSFWTRRHDHYQTKARQQQQVDQQLHQVSNGSEGHVDTHDKSWSGAVGSFAERGCVNAHRVDGTPFISGSKLSTTQHSGLHDDLPVQEPAGAQGTTGTALQEAVEQQPTSKPGLPHSKSVHFADDGMDLHMSGDIRRSHSSQGSHDNTIYKLQAPPTSAAQLAPMIAAAKTALASARFEPNWLRPQEFGDFDADGWATLLEDAELLLVRVSTLEALSEERQLQGLQLDDLQHYKNMADAMSLILAQLSAFLADVSRALQRQQCNRHVAWSILSWLGWSRGPVPAEAKRHMRHQHQQTSASKPTSQPLQQQKQITQASSSPFAAVATDTSQSKATQQQPEFELQSGGYAPSLSAVLSKLERQQSGMSSYLWEKKVGWETGRQLLQHEMEAAVGAYWWAVLRASKKAPVKVPKSREVMILTFVYPICNGLIDASERLEASAQRVLRGAQVNHSNTSGREQQRHKGLQSTAQAGAHSSVGMAQTMRSTVSKCQEYLKSRLRKLFKREQQWLQPLLRLLLLQQGLQAMRQAVCVDLKTAMSSRDNFRSLLRSRGFQAGVKMYLAAGSVLLATLLLMAYDVQIRSLNPLFGYTSVCLSMQERVEATTDKVVGRVLGTIVGACMGLAINHIPGTFSSPALLLACLGLACIPLSMVARAQARVSVALAIITLLSVSLCAYEAVCCTTGVHMSTIDVFLTRMGAVVGACIYVAILNQVLLPWYASSYALEQMADALEKAAALFGMIYTSQHDRMRLAAIAAGALLADDKAHAAGQVVKVPSSLPVAVATTQSGTSLGDQLQDTTSAADKRSGTSPYRTTDSPDMSGAAGQAPTVQEATAQLAGLEAAEADLHVKLRQEVLSRIIAVQMSLAKESVSWKRGVLVTPQVVLDVLGAMIECVEALASQRLALAPFTRQQDPSAPTAADPAPAVGHGLLRLSGHCYSNWAAPLHPCWQKTLKAVRELTHETAQYLRSFPAGHDATPSAFKAVEQKLSELERCRLDLRHTWLDIRRQLHQQAHALQQQQTTGAQSSVPSKRSTLGLPQDTRLLPTDSIHFFTFTYGASRVLNKFTGVAHAVLSTVHQQSDAHL